MRSDGVFGLAPTPRLLVEVLRFRLMIGLVYVEAATASDGKRSMSYYAGRDVSLKETSACTVDEAGKICREVKVVSHPEDLVQLLDHPKAAPLRQWLFSGVA